MRIHGLLRGCYVTARRWGWLRYDVPVSEPETVETEPTDTRPAAGLRIAGIALDWVLCMVISSAIFPAPEFAEATGVQKVLLSGEPLATLGIWALQHFVLVATLGMTYGHRLLRLRVVRDDGTRYPGFVSALKRTVLLALVIPAVVWDSEGRGLHDRAAGTHLVRLGAEKPAE